MVSVHRTAWAFLVALHAVQTTLGQLTACTRGAEGEPVRGASGAPYKCLRLVLERHCRHIGCTENSRCTSLMPWHPARPGPPIYRYDQIQSKVAPNISICNSLSVITLLQCTMRQCFVAAADRSSGCTTLETGTCAGHEINRNYYVVCLNSQNGKHGQVGSQPRQRL